MFYHVLGRISFLVQSIWHSVRFLYLGRLPPSLCWRNFVFNFVKNIFGAFDLSFFNCLYPQYSQILSFCNVLDFLDVLYLDFLFSVITFSLTDLSVSSTLSLRPEILSFMSFNLLVRLPLKLLFDTLRFSFPVLFHFG